MQTKRTAVSMAAAIRAGEETAVDAVKAVLERIDEKEELLHCYVTIDREGALAQAEQIQREIESGKLRSPLTGVPAAVKDNLCTKGMRTTCASKMLYDFVPAYSAEAVVKLQEAGVILLGKTNMDEFAMGSTTETSAFGVTRNPWNPEHVPGGSSGGSAAAVAAGECLFALGTDTGGSIRQPAACCGVVGLKPTYGTVSRRGLIAYASSLDQIGPIAGDVTDCAAILDLIAAHDPLDSTSLQREEENFLAALTEGVKGLRVGIPKDYLGEGLDAEILAAVEETAAELARRGAVVEYFDLGLTEYVIPAYYTIAAAEASSNLERYDGIKYGHRAKAYDGLHSLYKRSRSEGFGEEVKRRIMLGSFVLSSGYYDAYYLKALKVKTLIKRAFDEAFSGYDLLLEPVMPSTAPRLGVSLKNPMKMYLSDISTAAVNLAGLPAISIPCGRDHQGLPIGLQLIGDCFMEKKLLRAAYVCERKWGEQWKSNTKQ